MRVVPERALLQIFLSEIVSIIVRLSRKPIELLNANLTILFQKMMKNKRMSVAFAVPSSPRMNFNNRVATTVLHVLQRFVTSAVLL
jgi:hypothetical protein